MMIRTILGTINSKLNTVLIVLIASVLAAMGGALWWQGRALDKANAQVESLSLRLSRAIEANRSNVEAIDELTQANAALLERIRLDAVAAADEARRATERAREAERQRDEARLQLRAALDSEPSCEDLSRIDIAAACPAYADRLRDLQRRVGQD